MPYLRKKIQLRSYGIARQSEIQLWTTSGPVVVPPHLWAISGSWNIYCNGTPFFSLTAFKIITRFCFSVICKYKGQRVYVIFLTSISILFFIFYTCKLILFYNASDHIILSKGAVSVIITKRKQNMPLWNLTLLLVILETEADSEYAFYLSLT